MVSAALQPADGLGYTCHLTDTFSQSNLQNTNCSESLGEARDKCLAQGRSDDRRSMKLYLWVTLIQVYTSGICDAVPDTLPLNYLLLVLKMLFL